ncbi:Ig-like domain-containing protein [Pandoraea anhela]|uniref:Intimin n=1 Tax=Pandoraea anhela TaxID=2508295 RepID=A0A5E4TBY8_9BURK|nr:Ig-like domain-containing protein [Pandoraea anhela]VVD83599.1 Intimin [Pandoraea anhela]
MDLNVLETDSVGTLATLAAPTVSDASGNKLDPTLSMTTVVVPVYAGKTANDVVTLRWDGRAGAGTVTDSIRVTTTSVARQIRFNIDAPAIAANDGATVTVWYSVQHQTGTREESIRLILEVGEQAPVPGAVLPPQMSGVVNGVLNLDGIPPEGVTLTVPVYGGMARYDAVFVGINGNEWEDGKSLSNTTDVGQPVVFTIKREDLAKFSGREVSLRTTVIPSRGGDPLLSREMKVRILQAVGALPPVVVPLAQGNSLDPLVVTTPTVEVVVKPFQGIAQGDVITFTWANDSGVPAPFSGTQTAGAVPQVDYVFQVPRAHVDQNVDKTAKLSYTVTRGGGLPTTSQVLSLSIGKPFEGTVTLDLADKQYIVAEKPPRDVPEYGTFLREASFGTAPYRYSSSDTSVATVQATGRVLLTGNGRATITATDATNQTRSYTLNVSGIRQIFFVSPSANWAGARTAAAAAGVRVPTVDEFKAFWRSYYPSSGPVASYSGWLSYRFWTATELGAGTSFAYDLNGASEQGNATGRNQSDFLQVLGIAP